MTDSRPVGVIEAPEFILRKLLNLRHVLTPDFFSVSESIWETVSTVCVLLFVVAVLVLAAFVSVRIDSIRFLLVIVGSTIVLVVVHAINRRLFETLDQFVRGNELILTDENITDAFGVFALLAAFSSLPIGIYLFLTTAEPLALYAGGTITLVLLYIAAYMLNLEILNIKTSKEASIGDNGVTFLSIVNGIGPARVVRLAYGIAMLNGLLMFPHGAMEKLISSRLGEIFFAQDIWIWTAGLAGMGTLVIVIAAAVPFPLFLYIIVVHVFLDALSSLIRAKNLRFRHEDGHQ